MATFVPTRCPPALPQSHPASQTFRRFLRRKEKHIFPSPSIQENRNPAVCQVQIPNATGHAPIQIAELKERGKTKPVSDLPFLHPVKKAEVKQSSLTSWCYDDLCSNTSRVKLKQLKRTYG